MATVKIGFLAIRMIAKPITNGIKSTAKNHPGFKQFCVTVAQTYHNVDIRLNATLMGGPKPETVRPLTEAKAVELGADFLGEFIMFAVAAGIILIASVFLFILESATERCHIPLHTHLLRIRIHRAPTTTFSRRTCPK
ncbi:optic atrophy 3-like protein [Gonapodya prolifera JEL478]|uniref:Optic atrophy 3-like protein n=1 Tax=Gonapodya prolifera (strain JEL478) TaxID=1344416 RepID=A0A139AIM0_GONPJ|nr:optic atrophy 3-like protein [Gonapodya prolifera JEL478]|eukprot:KXS16394.1 optic atrophy 3-like protein [Gonapodya prolifera JEL478]